MSSGAYQNQEPHRLTCTNRYPNGQPQLQWHQDQAEEDPGSEYFDAIADHIGQSGAAFQQGEGSQAFQQDEMTLSRLCESSHRSVHTSELERTRFSSLEMREKESVLY